MKKLFGLPLLAAFLSTTACTSTLVAPEQYSGFLQDYSRLSEQQSPSGAKVARWIDPDLQIARYNQLFLEPSQFYPQPQPNARLSQETLQGITNYFDTALRRELSKVMPLTDSPTAGTLVLRPAITAVSASTEGLKPYEVIPIALVVAAASTAAGTRDQQVEIAAEAAVIDAQNSRVVAQVVRKGSGLDLDNDEQAISLDNVKPVIDVWANDMRQSVEQLKAKR
ncbi:DUF3313 domain-containing protein [Pseudomonas sp. NPDC077186]|uniref:DUF3313 domain-containing protein n=1 Tax=Pseudomonas sp. NPDC077186 TaxID=3364421 RepID=UPI0037C861F1